ncbi:hypothetical protein A1Q2_04832 [Trichosporon asahii var. asahii CBS 8904]|uniref:Uncharacterized protein n=2 Tax=Trichosporon asahii var. asahii TaxID=189963 RepID=K1WHB1_TRIAC|nr:hypothetical protein A1Q1_01326 [Trichosporon asahii var. asahii CBS 2479]EJT52831.1 hypothetical protein A1Q1_01326 [Trichosporon asahii var. asahii CBS 2479]EKD00864.1 hypothetical protein A1Q2_04832 [Trichosporon asahii var. asahii CBS 8904]
MQASQRLADCGSQAPRQAEFARLSPPGHQVMADTPPPRLYSTTYLVLSRLSLPAPVAPSLRPHARPSFLLSSNQRASGPLANIHLSFLIIIPYNSITPHPLIHLTAYSHHTAPSHPPAPSPAPPSGPSPFLRLAFSASPLRPRLSTRRRRRSAPPTHPC